MAKLKPGDEVWFYRWSAICSGTITCDVKPPKSDMADDGEYPGTIYTVRMQTINGQPTPGSTMLREEDAFATKADCIAMIMAKKNKKFEAYLSEIQTVQDLIQFLFEHQIIGEDRDEEAAKAAAVMAEKFGFGVFYSGMPPKSSENTRK